MMRKELGMQPGQPVEIWLAGDKDLLAAAKKQHKELSSLVSAKHLHLEGHAPASALVKEWEIEEMKLKVAIVKL